MSPVYGSARDREICSSETVDTFLIWKLTGGPAGGIHVTDVTNASRTQLVNLERMAWDEELLGIFGIPAAILPRICSSSENVAVIREGALTGVPVCGILGDQQAALVGQACFHSGEAKNTYGTGCFLLYEYWRGARSIKVRLDNNGCVSPGKKQPASYALEGSIAVTGALVQWLRDNLGLIKASSEVEQFGENSLG
jgi:glycerol kinase